MDQSAGLNINHLSAWARQAGYLSLWLLIAYWSITLMRPTPGATPWIFLDNFNLLIHEAGHWLFLPFGQFMTILGGSLNQCLTPTIFLGYFLYRKDWAGASFAIFWVGNNLINVSYYVGDARSMALPLLGGDSSGHDWHNLLSMTNALNYDTAISTVIRIAGYIGLFISLVMLGTQILSTWLNSPKDDTQPISGAAQ